MKNRMIENWMYAHRLSRAVFVAVALAGALAYTWWNWPAPLVSRTTQSGQVISAVKDGVMVIELPDGKHVRAFTPYPVPKPGDHVPMIVETYEDGSIHAVIDPEAVLTE